MTHPERPEEVYRPPLPPVPATQPTDDEADADSAEVETVKRRSRVVVIAVIAASATLLIGATVTIVMLTTGLLSMLGDRAEPAQSEPPAVVQPEPEEEPDPAPAHSGECGELCTTMIAEIGTSAGEWTAEGAWSDPAPVAFGATDAATAVFTSDAGTAVLTVLQFDTDEQAAQAVIDMAARIGEPSHQTTVFDDGSGTRYDYDGAITSRVIWHLDAESRPHAPGRLYLIEAPANDAADFSGQAAYRLYLSLPL